MRAREKIEYDINKYGAEVVSDDIILELLLDIRDLLDKKGIVVRK